MKIEELDIGKSLKKKREEYGLTRNDFAKQLFISEDAVKKWEQGKRIPTLPMCLSIATLFGTNISDLIGEIEETKKMKNIVDDLEINDLEAEEADIYKGYNDVLEEWQKYYRDYDVVVNDDGVDTDSWLDTNKFVVVIEPLTRNIYAIHDYGRYCLDADDILFRTGYIPMYTNQPENKEELFNHVNKIVEMYQSEISEMFRQSCKPLYLIRYCGTNNYIAWSLAENKPMCVYGYKKYRTGFGISDIDVWTVDNIKNNIEYAIIPPSREIIREMGLELNPDIWERKMSWDKWEPRNAIVPKNCVPDCYKVVCDRAVETVNKGRSYNYGMDDDFVTLENRVTKFERLVDLEAPSCLLDKQAEMMDDIASKINFGMNLDRFLEVIFEEADGE